MKFLKSKNGAAHVEGISTWSDTTASPWLVWTLRVIMLRSAGAFTSPFGMLAVLSSAMCAGNPMGGVARSPPSSAKLDAGKNLCFEQFRFTEAVSF